MNEKENYEALFNPKTEITNSSGIVSEEYSPSAKKGKNNVYQSLIRFVPWWKNPTTGSIREKWTSWLVDPVTEQGRFVDCPSSIGKESPLLNMYRKLKKSESVIMQGKADIFSRRHSYASLIQVIKDENNPELEGKIMVYRYGVKLWEKINAELKPVVGPVHDPFDLFDGKLFLLKITLVSGYNNYDQSKFVDKKVPLCIPDKEGKLVPITPDVNKKEVFEWVKTNSPNIEKYDYKEWDQETYDYVNHIIAAVTGESNIPGNYASIKNNKSDGSGNISVQPPNLSNTNKPSQSGITATELNLDDLDGGSNIGSDLPDLDLPDLPSSNDIGIAGDLDEALKGL